VTSLGGFGVQHAKPRKSWLFSGFLSADMGDGHYKIGIPDKNGILEVTYPNGETTLIQGVEVTDT